MAWLALPEVQCAHTLVPEHPDPQLDNVARAMCKLPQADFATLLGFGADWGATGPACLPAMGLAAGNPLLEQVILATFVKSIADE